MIDPSFWYGRRVLLTGHTGFKGSWLALWLTHLGAEVYGVALPSSTHPSLFHQLQLESSIFCHNLLDIRDFSSLQALTTSCSPEIVFHLAAQPLVRLSYRDPAGTWATNVQGSLHLLEALRKIDHTCAVVMVTTDKVYQNREWVYGYREDDILGGHDPYSASKAAAELAIASWRSSFCGTAEHQTPYISIASARSGNVIGGGDWSQDRIIPDAMRSLSSNQSILVRSPGSTRPWQHVLDSLSGYLLLAQKLFVEGSSVASSFNFGPSIESNKSVRELIEAVLTYWPGCWSALSAVDSPHEAGQLHLQIDKAYRQLGWRPCWPFTTTVERTVNWYREVHAGASPLERCLIDITEYQTHLM